MAADGDSPWGTGVTVHRTLTDSGPELPLTAAQKATANMAAIGWDRRNAMQRAVEPYAIDSALGIKQQQKPRVRMNADGGYTIRGIDGDTLFGPSQPLSPYAQDDKFGAVGRRFDYQVGYNIYNRPRGTEQVGYGHLRALADNYDLMRMVIETRKDQLEAMDWLIAPRDKVSDDDKAVKLVTDFLAYPDKEHGYNEWMRAILEDLFVIDAPCIYPRFTNGGDLYSLDLMDGAMIIPRLDATGRRPAPPDVAYQQIIKGMAAVDYSALDLIYRPRNVRTHKIYGYSPVEQVIVSVNIALRRQLFQLDYYREGSVPDAIGMLPDTWTPGMIFEFQKNWDALYSNETGENSAQRRKLRFIPNAKDVKFTKDAVLKDEYDEWLARIVCYAFSVEPTPFIKQVNRATAETQKNQSRSEGLVPLRKWWKSLMDYIITFYLKQPGLEFKWQDEEIQDPVQQSTVIGSYVDRGVLTVNEAREEIGKDRLSDPEADKPRIQGSEKTLEQAAADAEAARQSPFNGGAAGTPANGSPPAIPGRSAERNPAALPPKTKPGAAAAPKKPASKMMAKRGARIGTPVNLDRRPIQIQTQRLTRGLKRALRAAGKTIAAQIAQRYHKLTPAQMAKATPDDEANGLLEDINFSDMLKHLIHEVLDPLRRAFADGTEDGYSSVGIDLDPDFVSSESLDYANERAAEMVGMRLGADGVTLYPNPSALWQITDGTRDLLRGVVSQAMGQGWSNDRLQNAIESSDAFSPARAETIARTETALADSKGHLAAWKQAGVVERVVWVTADDDDVSDDCEENASQGPINVGDVFSSGDDSPPAHPNCRCALAPYFSEEGGDEGDDGGGDGGDDGGDLELVRLDGDLGKLRGNASGEPAGGAQADAFADSITKLAEAIAGHKTEINVSPPAVNVQVLSPPARKIERVAVRDKDGQISKMIERDVDG